MTEKKFSKTKKIKMGQFVPLHGMNGVIALRAVTHFTLKYSDTNMSLHEQSWYAIEILVISDEEW